MIENMPSIKHDLKRLLKRTPVRWYAHLHTCWSMMYFTQQWILRWSTTRMVRQITLVQKQPFFFSPTITRSFIEASHIDELRTSFTNPIIWIFTCIRVKTWLSYLLLLWLLLSSLLMWMMLLLLLLLLSLEVWRSRRQVLQQCMRQGQ